MISSAYFTAFFSPPRMNLDATLPRHFSRSQSKPADVKSWTTFFTNKFEKKQKNKPYKAFSRYRTDLSLVGLNSLLYMFFLRPPAERCFGKWCGINSSASSKRIGIPPCHIRIASAFIQKHKVTCLESRYKAVPVFSLLRHIGDAPVHWHEETFSSGGILLSEESARQYQC